MKKIVFLLLLCSATAQAGVFKCMTEDGHVTYSERPCVTGAVPYDAGRVSVGGNAGSASLSRGADGVFHAVGAVNGLPVNFIVDTGATFTTLSGDTAARLGLRSCIPAGVTNTANGQAIFCRVTVPRLTVASFNFVNVSVTVNPSMRGESLFGNDLLKQFTVNQQGNLLTLSR